MISRKELINDIFIQLGYVKERNIIELMKAKRTEEVKELADEFQFSELNEYIKRFGYVNLETEETTADEEWILPLVIYVWKSEMCDGRFFKHREEYRYVLSNNCGELGKHISEVMAHRFLFEIPLEELLGV